MKKHFRVLTVLLALCLGLLCPAASAAGAPAGELAAAELTAEAADKQIPTGGYEPVVTAHRGCSAAAPENTLPAFQLAIDQGCERAELDVQMTKDGVVMVTHDSNLRRCTGWNQNIYRMTYKHVRWLDAGRWFDRKYTGTKVPTLEEVLNLCKGKIKLNIEIKANPATPDLEAETVRLIYENGFENDCAVTSFSYESLCKVKELAPQLRTGYILNRDLENADYDLPAADFFDVDYNFITPDVIQQVHQRGKTIAAWTVDSETVAVDMMRLGVDGITTNKPDMVMQLRAQEALSTKS